MKMMTRAKTYLLFFTCLLLLTGCGGSNEASSTTVDVTDPDLIGYVVKKQEFSVLVVSELPKANENYVAIWVSGNKTTDLAIGQKVEVVFDGEIKTSNPGQATAEEITILTMQSPEHSTVSAEDALNQALSQVDDWEVPIVKEISYQNEDRSFLITLGDAKNAAHCLKISPFQSPSLAHSSAC